MPHSTPAVTRIPGAGSIALRRRLGATSGSGTVVHAGTRAVYARFGERALGVCTRDGVHVPATIATALPRLPEVHVGAAAAVRDGVLYVAGLAVGVDRLVPTDLPRLDETAMARLAPALPDVRAVSDQLPHDAVRGLAAADPSAVVRLLGRGDGLTPVGDDVLSGWLVAARAGGRGSEPVAHAVRRHAHRTTTLSATLLTDAVEGACIPQFRALLRALVSDRDLETAIAALAAVGHTSGIGMLLGAHLALSRTDPTTPAQEGMRR